MAEGTWETYEQVAVFLLGQVAERLGLERVEGKQGVYGSRSQTSWEIDGKGVKVGGEGFVIIECRRYTSSRQNQEKVAALAYRIQDSRASGGILVSPLGFQEGARRVAAAEDIQEVFLDATSTTTEYFLRFLNEAFVGGFGHSPRLRLSDLAAHLFRRNDRVAQCLTCHHPRPAFGGYGDVHGGSRWSPARR